MHIREGEVIRKVVKRHRTPYVIRVLAIGLIVVPFFLLIYFLGTSIEGEWVYFAYAIASFVIGAVVAIFSLDYLLDKLIITSKRVIWINWKTIFSKYESEAELRDIQDISTSDPGILSKISFLDYGLLEIETSATSVCILFEDCPDPDSVKHYILHQIECAHEVHASREPHP